MGKWAIPTILGLLLFMLNIVAAFANPSATVIYQSDNVTVIVSTSDRNYPRYQRHYNDYNYNYDYHNYYSNNCQPEYWNDRNQNPAPWEDPSLPAAYQNRRPYYPPHPYYPPNCTPPQWGGYYH